MSDTPKVKIMCGEIELCEGELVDVREASDDPVEDGAPHDVILCIRARAEPLPPDVPLSALEVGKIVFLPQEEEPEPKLVKAKAKYATKPLLVEIEDVGVMDVALVVGEGIAYSFSLTNAEEGEVEEGHPLYRKSVTVRFDIVSSTGRSGLSLN